MFDPVIDGAETCKKEISRDGPGFVFDVIQETILFAQTNNLQIDPWSVGYINYFRRIYAPLN